MLGLLFSMKTLISLLLFISCAWGAYHVSLNWGFVNPYPAVCNLVAQKIFIEDEQIKKWHRLCMRRQRLVTSYSPRSLIIKDINNALGLLNVSHLEVFDAAAVKAIWRGESKETGIESEFVDSELVIFKVHPKSPADIAGLKKGDVIASINGEQPNPWEAQSTSGNYRIERLSETKIFKIKAEKIVRSEQVSFEKFGSSIIVKIPSFQARFFREEALKEMFSKISPAKRVIVDMRGNSGGNFVAGLRFLSILMCKSEEVGRLIKPKFQPAVFAEMPDDLEDSTQLAVLDQHKEVILKTYERPECYHGEIRVLVDGKSASVAEMVAQALKEFKQARLMGSSSRGQLLVGVWYPLPEIGPGVEISIPEAYYRSAKMRRIENEGVDLDKVLYYDLDEMQQGTDSWVRRASE